MTGQGWRPWAVGARASTWRMRIALTAVMGSAVVSMLLTACGPAQGQAQADQSKAKLDHELSHARSDLGIPDSLLQPIVAQETKISSGEGGWNYNYQDAAANYTLLYTQLVGVEQTAAQTLKRQATDDIQAFSTAVTGIRAQGFDAALVATYQSRLYQVGVDFNAARSPGDFAHVDTFARQQTEALNAMGPAYAKLQEFNKVILAVSAAGFNSPLAQNFYQADLNSFNAALSASSYQALVVVIDGQITQLEADQTEALPYIGSSLLDQFQARIDQLKSYGENAAGFQSEHDKDTSQLKSASSLADYLALSQTINQQTEDMALPLLRGAARQKLNELAAQVDFVNTHDLTVDPANGISYSDAYEYANPFWGVGDAQQVFNSARTLGDYQHAYNYAWQLYLCILALQDNLHDKTPLLSAHVADLTLLSQLRLTGKVVFVSLRDQAARFYLNGKLVFATYVTTGNIDTPSVPGVDNAMYKMEHTVFTSPDPPGSPLWYAPTPINYAIAYAPGGYFLHDAWWRAEFGPYTNLPHWDPAAFNGGSHGCVNFPLNVMGQVYDWVDVNTPIVVY